MAWLIAVGIMFAFVVGALLFLRPRKLPQRLPWLGPIAEVKKRKGNVVEVDFEGARLVRALRESIRREQERKSKSTHEPTKRNE